MRPVAAAVAAFLAGLTAVRLFTLAITCCPIEHVGHLLALTLACRDRVTTVSTPHDTSCSSSWSSVVISDVPSYTVRCWSGSVVVFERKAVSWTIDGAIMRLVTTDGDEIFGQGMSCTLERTPR